MKNDMGNNIPLDLVNQVSMHEAGHYIVGRALGFKVGEISVQLLYPDGFAGGCSIELYQKIKTLEETKKYLKNRIQVLYAGVLSQSLKANKIDEDKANEFLTSTKDCNDDFSKIRELLRILLNIEYSGESSDESEIQKCLDEITEDLWQSTIAIVENEQEYIKGIGGSLARKVVEFGEITKITIEELNGMKALKKRFGAWK